MPSPTTSPVAKSTYACHSTSNSLLAQRLDYKSKRFFSKNFGVNSRNPHQNFAQNFIPRTPVNGINNVRSLSFSGIKELSIVAE